jgi:hypothetical protein
MHPQIQLLADEFDAARHRLRDLVKVTPDAYWTRRPDPDRWSMAECIAHLNLTSAACIPVLRAGFSRAALVSHEIPALYRHDLIGWLLWRRTGPPVRFRVKTTASFVPLHDKSLEELFAEFDRYHGEQLACVRDADGLPLAQVKIVSPFRAGLRYNLYSCLSILPRHQHRHLWQAEGALEAIRNNVAFPSA